MPTEPATRTSAWGLAVVAGVFLLLFGFGSTPASGDLVAPPWDKVVHLGVFALFAAGLRARWPDAPWYVLFLLAASVAVADELHQFLVPSRHPEWDDGFADLTGAAAGLLAWTWAMRRQSVGKRSRNISSH